MLRQLHIKNFALIDELDIGFSPGFSVITGETGAGKSIILGAIGLLLGQRADSKLIKSGAGKCTVEAHFDLSKYNLESFFSANDIDYDSEDCIIRRELTAAGKSRAFINDTPVPLTLMKTLGEQLVDIHSQHQNLLLQKEDFQLNVVDTIAQDRQEITDYKAQYSILLKAEETLRNLKENIAKSLKDEEYIRFQLQELEKAQLKEGLQEQLEQESDTLSHSEEIKSALFETDGILNNDDNGVVEMTRKAALALHTIENVYPNVRELAERMDSTHIELKDMADDITSHVDAIDFDPNRLEAINDQLDTIYSLEQKFHVGTIEELLQIRQDLKAQLEHIENSDEELEQLTGEVERQRQHCEKRAEKLTTIRRKAAKKIEKEMQERLIPLGIPNVRFEISQQQSEHLGPNGHDKIQFLFSANKSTSLQPISQVASGGEIARVMLSLKAMISGAVKLPTIIFDEIDTGVSGKIAQKMASIMQEMGRNDRQVLSITHLPQIAALGQQHYKVYKEETEKGTISHMVPLTPQQRVQEIAQMLSGDNITEAAINNAKELLTESNPVLPFIKKHS